MKNHIIKKHGGFQGYIDHIIHVTDFADYSEDGVQIQEETHIDVDMVLAEPVPHTKKSKLVSGPAHSQVPHKEIPRAPHVMSCPRRERLIMNLHDPVRPVHSAPQNSKVLSFLFSY